MTKPQEQELLAAIGGVVRDSSFAVQSLQLYAAELVGSDVVSFTMRDAMMGKQVADVRAWLKATDTGNQWVRHLPVNSTQRDLALNVLKILGGLAEIRNRLVHDEWEIGNNPDDLELIVGSQAARWSKHKIETNIPTILSVGRLFFQVAVFFSAAMNEMIRYRTRHDGPDHHLPNRLPEMLDVASQLDTSWAARDSGGIDAWRWRSFTTSM